MGTCIGHRNLRYFVCFLCYTALHAFYTCLLSVLYFYFISMGEYDFLEDKRSKEGDKVELSKFIEIVQVFNGISMIYSFAFFLMLACFGLQMHM